MAIPEFHYKSLDQITDKRDELLTKIAKSIDKNESLDVRRDLEKQLEVVQERLDKLQEYLKTRERNISEGKSI